MTTPAIASRSGVILRQRLSSEIAGVPVVWAVAVVLTALLVGVVAVLRDGDIAGSGWEQAAQVTRWYAGGVGVYLTSVYLPLYVTHGYTRREFSAQVPVLLVAFAVAYGVFMSLGFAVESLVYGVLDWPQDLTRTHLFAGPTDWALVFTESALLGGAWAAAGLVLGGAFYRNGALGLVLIPVALVMVGLVETAVGSSTIQVGPFPTSLPLIGPSLVGASPATATLVGAGVFVTGVALMWAVVRDMPIRPRAT